jgi:hypothetical protein
MSHFGQSGACAITIHMYSLLADSASENFYEAKFEGTFSPFGAIVA